MRTHAIVVALALFAGASFAPAHAHQSGWMLRGPNLAPGGFTRIVSTSPADGESGVGVYRETVLKFSAPVDSASITAGDVVTRFGGQPIPNRLELQDDRVTLKVFYLAPLPSNAQVTFTVEADAILDTLGNAIDADGDGAAGGERTIVFQTLNLSRIPGTTASGRVFATELDGTRGSGFVNVPLSGVKIFAEGLEDTCFTFTDAKGNFTLENTPAGDFFVFIDGRAVAQTPSGSPTVFPTGPYYPFVGKRWTTSAGRDTTIADIYLPLVPAGTLRPVLANGLTNVTFPNSVLADRPELDRVLMIVPPNSLYGDDGVRGGWVGMAAVDPARLPEPLPESFAFPVVITIQTDGPQNFSDPPSLCLPNLPDPETGLPLPSGSKSALWSFNHDTGVFEIAGAMTVTRDGSLVCTDAGVGIPAPGWHGTQPGSQVDGGELESDEEDECTIRILSPIVGRVNTPITFSTTVSGGGGGTYRWASPAANPADGSDPTYTATFDEPGTFSVLVQYTTADFEATCSAIRSIEILSEPCEVTIDGPSTAAAGEPVVFTAQVPDGTKQVFAWNCADTFPQQSAEPAFATKFSFVGTKTVSLSYTYIDNAGKPQSCYAQKEVLVDPERLVIFASQNLFSGILNGREHRVGETLRIFPSTSSAEGTYSWTGSAGLSPGGSSNYDYTATLSSAGPQSVTVTLTPSDGGEPRSATANFNVLPQCDTVIVVPTLPDPNLAINQMPLNQDITFTAQVSPEGGTYEWNVSGGGAQPAIGNTAAFTTRFTQQGVVSLSLTYRPEGGGDCTYTQPLFAGTPECTVEINGPGVIAVNQTATYSASSSGGGGDFFATYFDALGGDPVQIDIEAGVEGAFVFNVRFPAPGTYRIEVINVSQFQGVTEAICNASRFIEVVGAAQSAPAARGGDEGLSRQTGLHYFARVNRQSGAVVRGRAGSAGFAHPVPLRLRAETAYREYILQARTLKVGVVDFTTQAAGGSLKLPAIRLLREDSIDIDGDGLTAIAEFIMGTDAGNPDSDGDGVPDGIEVQTGQNPLSNSLQATGLVAVADTPGDAFDVAADGSLVVVADGSAGLAVFNAFNGLDPLIVAQIPTSGDARAVTMEGNIAIAALGTNGAIAFDLENPQLPIESWRHNEGDDVVAVEAALGFAFLGLRSGEVLVLDLTTGTPIGRRNLFAGPIRELTFGNARLYALAGDSGSEFIIPCIVADPASGAVGPTGFLSTGELPIGAPYRSRLFVTPQHLFYAHRAGFNVYDLTNPDAPTLARGNDLGLFGFRQLVAVDPILGAAAASPNSTDDGPHNVYLYDLTKPSAPASFLEEIETNGLATAVAAYNGLVYVADRAAGLAVLNPRSFDIGSTAPTVTIATNQTPGQAEEGSILALRCAATDDVLVRNVEFFVDGIRVATDGSYPFEHPIRVPFLADRNTITVRAVAFDTGGNRSDTGEQTLTIVEDATAPVLIARDPESFSSVGVRSKVSAVWNEPLDSDSLAPSPFTLTFAGADGIFDNGDDTNVAGSIAYIDSARRVEFTAAGTLLAGTYRARFAAGVRDLVGNEASAVEWTFNIRGPRVLSTTPANGATVDVRSVAELLVTFDADMDAGTIGSSTLTLQDENAASIPVQSVTYDPETRRARFALVQPIADSGNYLATLSADVEDVAGNPLEEPRSWSFAVLGLRPVEFSPGEGTTVATGQTVAFARFAAPLDPSTVTVGSVTVQQCSKGCTTLDGPRTVTYDPETFTVSIEYANTFPSGFVEITLLPTIRDSFGGAITESRWSFEVDAPRIVGGTPAPGALLNVGDDVREISVEFLDPLDPASVGPEVLIVFEAGPDGRVNTEDDIQRTGVVTVDPPTGGANARVVLTLDVPLGAGRHRIFFDSFNITDIFGNRFGSFEGSFNWIVDVAASGTVRYIGPQFGEWNVPAHWSTGRVPSLGEDVVIDTPSQVSAIEQDIFARSITIGDGTAAALLNLDGTTLHLRDVATVNAGATLLLDWFGTSIFALQHGTISGGIRLDNFGTMTMQTGILELPVVNRGRIDCVGNDNGQRHFGEGLVNEAGATVDISFRTSAGDTITNRGTVRLLKNQFINAGLSLGASGSDVLFVNEPEGVVTIDGPGTIANFFILQNGEFLNRGTVTAAVPGGIDITSRFRNEGTFTITAGDMAWWSSFTNSGGGTYTEGGGLTEFNNVASLLQGSVTSGGDFKFLGGGAPTIAGELRPGPGVATMNFEANLSLSATAVLEIDLAPGAQDKLVLPTGNLALAGRLRIVPAEGFDPAIGETFEIATAAAVTGTFSTVQGATLGNGKAVQVSYEPTRVVLEVIAAP